MNALGEFSAGQARFVILEVKGSAMRCTQTHSFTDGSLLPQYQLAPGAGGLLDISAAETSFPVGFIIPQNHATFDDEKVAFADLDNQTLELCPVCVGNSVDPQTLVGACTSCISNANTISYLKTV